MASLLETFLDKGLAPLAALAGVGMTLALTGRREKERAERESAERQKQDQREKAARLRERRVQLFIDVSQHVEEWINALLRMLNTQEQYTYPYGDLRPLAGRTPALAGGMALLAHEDMEEVWREFEQYVIDFSEAIDRWLELSGHDDTAQMGHAVNTLEEKGQALFDSASRLSATLRLAVTRIDTD